MRDLLRFALVSMLAVLSPWLAADIPFRAAVFLGGGYPFQDLRNIHSLGIAEFSNWTIFYWSIAFSILSCVFIFTIKWMLSRDSDVLYWIGGVAGIAFFFFHHSLLVIGRFG